MKEDPTHWPIHSRRTAKTLTATDLSFFLFDYNDDTIETSILRLPCDTLG